MATASFLEQSAGQSGNRLVQKGVFYSRQKSLLLGLSDTCAAGDGRMSSIKKPLACDEKIVTSGSSEISREGRPLACRCLTGTAREPQLAFQTLKSGPMAVRHLSNRLLIFVELVFVHG